MLSDEELADVPWHDPDLAFVVLERKARTNINRAWESADDRHTLDDLRTVYINAVIAFAHQLEVDVLRTWEPISADQNNISGIYQNFIAQVDYFTWQVRLRSHRQTTSRSLWTPPRRRSFVIT